MSQIVELKPWVAVFGAFFATFMWRFLGLVLAERISSTGLLIRWINAVAYSMVAGVLMLILTNPPGILLTSSLFARLTGLFFAIFAIYITENIFFSIIVGIAVFVLFTKI